MKFLENLDHQKVAAWFDAKLAGRQPFFYSSVDIRNSGHKVAPVDTNLFPAGFNNLSGDAVKNASEQARKYFEQYYPDAKKVAVLTENFSRNKFYWDNISALKKIIEQSGREVVLTVDDPEMPSEVESQTNGMVKLSRIEDLNADLVILNRDLTSGTPAHLLKLNKPIIPSPSMGWHTRRKSQHFDSYDILARDFAAEFGFDPWLISTIQKQCGQIDFKKGEGLEELAREVDGILAEITKKYAEYGVKTDPYVYIKSDSGTFGMGIMTVKSGAEVLDMNKKLRNKMDRIKEGVQNTEVIIQEGVPTIDEIDGKPAEPFLYCINNKPVGAILRINENRDEFGNLNSAGMYFEPVNCTEIAHPCEFSPLGLIARMASLAAVYEVSNIKVEAA